MCNVERKFWSSYRGFQVCVVVDKNERVVGYFVYASGAKSPLNDAPLASWKEVRNLIEATLAKEMISPDPAATQQNSSDFGL